MRLQAVEGTEQAEPVAESDHVLTKADLATVEALRPGTALLVVLRGPNTGARFLLDDDEVIVRAPPRQRHLPRRRHGLAQARGLPAHRERLRRARRRLAQRHLRQPRARRRGHPAPPATRCRSASSGSSSTRARPDPHRDRRGRGVASPWARWCAALSEEFPDVTISKVRFLEAEGLVTPARTASGYRQFTPDDVERLRYVLRAQRDRFWPLKVIKDNLEAIDRGLTPGDAVDGRAAGRPRRLRDPDVPDAGDLAARRVAAAHRRRAGPGQPAWRRTRSPTSRRTACCAPTPAGLHDDADLAGGPRRRGAGGLRRRAPAPARLPRRRRPRGRPGRAGRRPAPRAPTPSGTPPRWPTCASSLHAALVRGGLSGRAG